MAHIRQSRPDHGTYKTVNMPRVRQSRPYFGLDGIVLPHLAVLREVLLLGQLHQLAVHLCSGVGFIVFVNTYILIY